MVLIIIGGAMAIASSQRATIENEVLLFVMGWSLVLFGIVSWLIPELGRWIKRRQRIMAKRAHIDQREVEQVRRRAPPRR